MKNFQYNQCTTTCSEYYFISLHVERTVHADEQQAALIVYSFSVFDHWISLGSVYEKLNICEIIVHENLS